MTDGTDNLYSQFVVWSKVMLPLAALALLSTLFLFARSTGPNSSTPIAEIEAIAREPRITEPYFSGIANDGSVISIAADEIRPDPDQPDAFAVGKIEAEIEATDGSHVTISAGEGQIDPRARLARMTGLARMTSSSGYVMETAGVVADLDSGTVTSIGPLEVQAPYGDLTAGGLILSVTDTGTGQQMVFNGGVRLLYQPQPEGTRP
jgi:lipopolysaccharide export system protein LptC